MTRPLSPQRWASDITVILRTALGAERFPVDVKAVAREISKHKFPDDPITMIRGDVLPRFEGALVPAPPGKTGWGIVYNQAISSPGQINFTLGHEFGHYLLHRIAYPKGFQCSSEDMVNWESEYGQLEQQANVFAASLLMPLDDFRTQIDARSRPSLDDLGGCADRYDVSLIAATLRWLQYTERRSLLVVSKDGFILWARSSQPAFKSGLYFKTRNVPPVEIPTSSLAAQRRLVSGPAGEADHDRGVWLNQPCKEFVVFSDQYDFTISLLHFGDALVRSEADEEAEEDAYDRMIRRKPGESWLS
ncbi:MAG: ImmA/IrrE family metallo-endopeptidase [Hyphomicrobiales bacterium]|nr:ImmA/IrrE family metallo-endopeptidase [Hyphomicrobiales bacterium]